MSTAPAEIIPEPHRLTEHELVALARCVSTCETMRTLIAARRSRTLLLIRFIVETTADVRARAAYQALRRVQRAAPTAVARILDHPSVGAWATRTAARVNRGEPAEPGGLAWVAMAAAVRGRVDVSVSPPESEAIFLPSLGIALRPAAEEIQLRCGPNGVDLGEGTSIPYPWWDEAPRWRPTPRIAVDRNGLRASFLLDRWGFGELGPAVDVAAEFDVARWRDRIVEGWDLLGRHHRTVAEELAAAVSVLTPLRENGDGQRSATADDAFGCLFLSLPSDAQSVAVTLTHELQHTKLIALMDLFPMVNPGGGNRFYAPWREDPRPAAGLLHGIFAFAGVTGFWRRQRTLESSAERERHANVEFARWRTGVLDAARALLGSDRLTTVGRTFVTVIADTLEQWCAEPVPDDALTTAAQLVEEHRSRWRAAHGAV